MCVCRLLIFVQHQSYYIHALFCRHLCVCLVHTAARKKVGPSAGGSFAGAPASSGAFLQKLAADVSRFSSPGSDWQASWPQQQATPDAAQTAPGDHVITAVNKNQEAGKRQRQYTPHEELHRVHKHARRSQLSSSDAQLARALQLGVRASQKAAPVALPAPTAFISGMSSREIQAVGRGEQQAADDTPDHPSTPTCTADATQGTIAAHPRAKFCMTIPRSGQALMQRLEHMAAAKSERCAQYGAHW